VATAASPRGEVLRARDVTTAFTLAGLAVATVALRLPLLAPRLAHWDAVNYALGLHTFDIAAHQPHPPGSPYFILLGRAALLIVGDDNVALQLVSVAASALAVLLEYALARTLFGKTAGLLAALLLATQPVFWGYGTTASAWTVLAACSLGIALVSLRLLQGQKRLVRLSAGPLGEPHGGASVVYLSAVLLGVVSGFRADASVFLAPLWFWCLSRAAGSWRQRALAVTVAVATTLVWLVPVVATAGGPVLWLDRLLALLPATTGGAAGRQLLANTAIAFGTLAFTVGPPLLLCAVLNWRATRTWLATTLRSDSGVFLGLWVLPAFTFLWLIDSTEPGHGLVFIGALMALAGGLIVRLSRGLAIGAAVAALQALVFLFAPPLADRPLAWTANSMLLNVTAPGLRQQQTSLEATLQTIRGRFSPTDTAVATLLGQDAYRFMMYYLPEYTVARLDPSAHSILTARGRSQGNWTFVTGCLFETTIVRNTVLVLMAPIEPGTIPQNGTPLSEGAGPFQVWQLDASQSQDYLGFPLSGACS
jgi:dolichyl-phosphate-mannose-protein mannosyltransferase